MDLPRFLERGGGVVVWCGPVIPHAMTVSHAQPTYMYMCSFIQTQSVLLFLVLPGSASTDERSSLFATNPCKKVTFVSCACFVSKLGVTE